MPSTRMVPLVRRRSRIATARSWVLSKPPQRATPPPGILKSSSWTRRDTSWSIPARYTAIRRVPTGILRVLLQPEDGQLVGHILRRGNFYNSRGGYGRGVRFRATYEGGVPRIEVG